MTRNALRITTAGTVAAMALGGVLVAGTTGAGADESGRQLAGTWRVLVQPDGAPPAAAFESTIAYTATGSVVEATSKALSSAGLGVWERAGAGRFSTTIEKYRFDDKGGFIGKTRIQEVQEVAPDGEHYTGRATTTFLTATGGVIATMTSTTTGDRL